ncbi:hypothetical protein [Nocardia amikacinitolerans]|uniref:hypothetical protein n=1 Tax=Nocardia amikacinitolerans TaxID=756689 RepID=UPI0020A2B08A|nr:hypothetical protein [Nocardia amikacinitolerans]MCP2290809.1 hypothetical protein [Nocardia amikacinitolerans]
MTDNAHTATDRTPADTLDHAAPPEALCPIEIGDEVTGRNNRTWRGVVRSIYSNDGILRCAIETTTGRRGFASPWDLAPAHSEPSQEWLDRMRAYQRAEHDRALARLHRDQNRIAEQAEALAQQLAAIAATLRAGRVPDRDTENYLDTDANNIDNELADLTETWTTLANSGLLTNAEIRRHTVPAPH